jgi:hypothetical protein
MANDPLLTHAREFTDFEVPTLTLWNQLQDAGEADLARRLLDAGLQVEHYTSLLPAVDGDRTPEQRAQQGALRRVWLELIDQARTVLGSDAGG